jgi:hypothetical protein
MALVRLKHLPLGEAVALVPVRGQAVSGKPVGHNDWRPAGRILLEALRGFGLVHGLIHLSLRAASAEAHATMSATR